MTYRISNRILLYPAVAMMVIFLFHASVIKSGVQNGLFLSFAAVIPAVFPFAVMSSYIIGKMTDSEEPFFLRPLGKLFGLPRGGTTCFLIGVFCGFPLGAKSVADGYRAGLFSKDEAERMLMFCNNTGPAFLVGGIGSMRSSEHDGWYLFVVQCVIVCLVALLTRRRNKKMPVYCTSSLLRKNTLHFSDCVTGAVKSTLCVMGFVLFFSTILSIISLYVSPTVLLYLACILEVSHAAKLSCKHPAGLMLTAFAVVFSGVSVLMQSAAMLDGTDLSIRKCVFSKIFSGVLAFCFMYLLLQLT